MVSCTPVRGIILAARMIADSLPAWHHEREKHTEVIVSSGSQQDDTTFTDYSGQFIGAIVHGGGVLISTRINRSARWPLYWCRSPLMVEMAVCSG